MPLMNKFAATCTQCEQEVRPGDGWLEKVGGAWKTKHKTCPTRRAPEQHYEHSSDLQEPPESYWPEMNEADWMSILNPDEGSK